MAERHFKAAGKKSQVSTLLVSSCLPRIFLSFCLQYCQAGVKKKKRKRCSTGNAKRKSVSMDWSKQNSKTVVTSRPCLHCLMRKAAVKESHQEARGVLGLRLTHTHTSQTACKYLYSMLFHKQQNKKKSLHHWGKIFQGGETGSCSSSWSSFTPGEIVSKNSLPSRGAAPTRSRFSLAWFQYGLFLIHS